AGGGGGWDGRRTGGYGGRHLQGGEGAVGVVVREGLRGGAAQEEQVEHLARGARGRHRPQVLPQTDAEVRHRRGRRRRRRLAKGEQIPRWKQTAWACTP